VARPAPVLAPADHALIEAMRINAELARAVIDKFPMMLESAAVLLRAAANAGMPQRPPPLIERRRTEPASSSPAAGAYEPAASAAESSVAEAPTLDGAEDAHFASVLEALTPREGMLVHALAAELSPPELRAWIAEMKGCSLPEAVARIRVVLEDAARWSRLNPSRGVFRSAEVGPAVGLRPGNRA
jgi:hypothetical protein